MWRLARVPTSVLIQSRCLSQSLLVLIHSPSLPSSTLLFIHLIPQGAASNMWSRRIADDYRPGEDPLLDHLTPSATTAGTATSTGAAASKAASSGSARKPANATTGGLPFDASAVTFITNMTWNAAPGSRWTDETVRAFDGLVD